MTTYTDLQARLINGARVALSRLERRPQMSDYDPKVDETIVCLGLEAEVAAARIAALTLPVKS